MLSFFQGSRARSEPIHLYQVAYGVSESSRLHMTDAEEPVVAEGVIYQPVQIKHGEINASGSLDKSTVDLKAPRTNPLVELFRVYPPSQVVSLTIYRGERNDPEAEFMAIWSGRILNFAIEVNEAKFSCEPIGTSVQRPGLRRNYQVGCPHILYGPSCRANKLAATRSTVAETISGSTVTLPAGWFAGQAPADYLSGLMEWIDPEGNRISRTILRLADGAGSRSLMLGGLPAGLSEGMAVDVILGCNHQMSHCRNLHDNILNYGGQPWIPAVNPVGNYNNFY